ncbi:palindromic element RPE3 domain-containing protein [Rickettsia endosymbiont of Nabis limbatus]|uniref:palindromic element RPE3 domain-containing protein n=1 Tax=Rickettsia endosymbiont of Nabis limbatus TaxID=3066268 RepID=UPI003AF362EE
MLNHLKSLLQNYNSIHPEEIISKEKMLEFLDKHLNLVRSDLKMQLNSKSFRQDKFEDEPVERTKVREQRQISKNSLVSSFLNDVAGHFTASAFLLNHDQTKFLLMNHKKFNKWQQLGGHCESDNILAEATREAQEESGINEIEAVSNNIFDIDVHYIPQTSKESSHYHYDIRFLLKIIDNDNFIKNNESHELKWFSFADYPQLGVELERSVTRMIEKYISCF